MENNITTDTKVHVEKIVTCECGEKYCCICNSKCTKCESIHIKGDTIKDNVWYETDKYISQDEGSLEAVKYMKEHRIPLWGVGSFHCTVCGEIEVMHYKLKKEFSRGGDLIEVEIFADAYCADKYHRDSIENPTRVYRNNKWKDPYGLLGRMCMCM